MNKTATFIPCPELDSWNGDARLFKLSEPLEGHDYVIVSAVVAEIGLFGTGPETFIFGADENGEVRDWGELTGSFRGDLNHAEALANAGYIIVADPLLLN